MANTEITITAPDSAQAGRIVDIEVAIKNVASYPEPHTIYALPVLEVNGRVVGEGSEETLVPEQTRSWHFQYMMPDYDIELVAKCWAESYYFGWHLDSTAQKVITSIALVPEFSVLVVTSYSKV